MATEPSEYGRGLVICLVKFAEHFGNPMARRIRSIHFWHETLKENDAKLKEYGKDLAEDVRIFKMVELGVRDSYESGMASLIELWANGATDHLYDIKTPDGWDKELCALIKRLQDVGLEMGHGFTGKQWGYKNWTSLRDLTKSIAVLIDKYLGLADADIGEH